MKDNNKELFLRLCQDLFTDRERSKWVRGLGVLGWARFLGLEVYEALYEAAVNRSMPKLRDELGDVLWVWIQLVFAAEDAGHFTMEEVIQRAIDKLHRRKPWLFDGSNLELSPEEEVSRYKANKALEKDQDGNGTNS